MICWYCEGKVKKIRYVIYNTVGMWKGSLFLLCHKCYKRIGGIDIQQPKRR